MQAPADRYAAAQARSVRPSYADFLRHYSFDLDDFQRQACHALEDGDGVLVCAPTGAGKTVVGEFAVHLAVTGGGKCFYTTPIKALSNQKYGDLVERYGAAEVGLLTGDNTINPGARVIVMTTEVLRNMLYAGSPTLAGLRYVVMDEVHYLADRFRGAVWEEVIIHLPSDVALVSLSATVSNAEEFGEWLVTVRGDTRVIVSEQRPVPLWQHMLVGHRLYDLYAAVPTLDMDGTAVAATVEIDPELQAAVREQDRRLAYRSARTPARGQRPRRPPPRPHGPRYRPPDRAQVVEILDRAALLPAITFIFSRGGCDQAVRQCVRAGLRLTDDAEREEIRAVVARRTAAISAEDLQALGYWEWAEGVERGVAAHHAGLIPAFKEAVEELFAAGLVQAVFATETLALGINMPARSVVLERLVKYNGEAHAELTPGEYTQLTGRAGRRGIDIEGHAVVLWTPDVEPTAVAGLASTRTYPLRSSFRPSYNMAVNLVAQLGRTRARQLLSSSFAQFQADRAVVGLTRQVERNEEALVGYRAAMRCSRGDFPAYAALQARLRERESELARVAAVDRRSAAAQSLEQLSRGDVIRIPGGRRAGLAVVIDVGRPTPIDLPLPTVLTLDRRVRRLSVVDVSRPVESVTRMRIPPTFDLRSARSRRDLASSLRNLQLDDARPVRRAGAAGEDTEIADLRARLRAHPCHDCPDREEHARWAARAAKQERETAGLRDRIERRTNSLARIFDRVCGVLSARGYLTGETDELGVSPDGHRLSRIWGESDLLVAECLRHRVWANLSAAQLAAVASILVYESRRTESTAARVPTEVGDAVSATQTLWRELAADEKDAALDRTREPDTGFAWPVYRWARGESLAEALAAGDVVGSELPAGDFVRWCRQVIDLLEQISRAAETGDQSTRQPAVAVAAQAAVAAIRRGVVAADGWT